MNGQWTRPPYVTRGVQGDGNSWWGALIEGWLIFERSATQRREALGVQLPRSRKLVNRLQKKQPAQREPFHEYLNLICNKETKIGFAESTNEHRWCPRKSSSTGRSGTALNGGRLEGASALPSNQEQSVTTTSHRNTNICTVFQSCPG